MVIYYKTGSELKCGIIVSRKVDKSAVKRNKAKRHLREAFRMNKPDKKGQYILIARAAIKDNVFSNIVSEFKYLTRKLVS